MLPLTGLWLLTSFNKLPMEYYRTVVVFTLTTVRLRPQAIRYFNMMKKSEEDHAEDHFCLTGTSLVL